MKKKMEEEEKERKMLALNHRVGEGLSLTDAEWSVWRKWATSSSSSAGKRRKRKKRRKRRLPRTSSHSTHGRPRRRHRQWHVPGWSPGFGASHAVFPSIVDRPELPGLMVGMDCYMCYAGVVDYDAPRVVFPYGVARPRMLCIMADMD